LKEANWKFTEGPEKKGKHNPPPMKPEEDSHVTARPTSNANLE